MPFPLLIAEFCGSKEMQQPLSILLVSSTLSAATCWVVQSPFAFTSCLPEVGGGGLWRLRGIEVRLGKTVLMIHRIIHKRSVCERLICLLIELSFKFSFIKLYKFGLL